jgi:hypothetical protein
MDWYIPFLPLEFVMDIPNFGAVSDSLRQVGGEKGILVVEIFHRRLVTAEDIKRLDGYISRQ